MQAHTHTHTHTHMDRSTNQLADIPGSFGTVLVKPLPEASDLVAAANEKGVNECGNIRLGGEREREKEMWRP
jgi:hypothetical protein